MNMPNVKGLLILLSVGLLVFFVMTAQRLKAVMQEYNIENELNLLDGCYHVYLDVGSNLGVQVRKLYQPNLYPRAPFNEFFDKVFGPVTERMKTVCAIGFEPNPKHKKILSDIEKSYKSCGWRVRFMTESAVSHKSGHGNFYSDLDMLNKEWGGGILSPDYIKTSKEKAAKPIKLVRLSQFLLNVVAMRKLPTLAPENGVLKGKPPTVLMKMDIEGSEIDVLPDILFNGGLGEINYLLIEFHQRSEKLDSRKGAHTQLKGILESLSKFTKSMNGTRYEFNLVNIDDESYLASHKTLPKC